MENDTALWVLEDEFYNNQEDSPKEKTIENPGAEADAKEVKIAKDQEK